MTHTKRIAMWSGPRNLSTALMYSFAQREDCEVWDEPFYAAYLASTGLQHPLAGQIIAAGQTDPNRVSHKCARSKPNGCDVFYQKHMTQHMINGFDRNWLSEVTNVFLIRHPARVLASYDKKRSNPTLSDIGFKQQFELIELVMRNTGSPPIVVDSFDIRQNPAGVLQALCLAIGIEFDPSMLSWPKGGNANDGVWAAHWYESVWGSCGFSGSEGAVPEVAEHLAHCLDEAMLLYEQMAALKLLL